MNREHYTEKDVSVHRLTNLKKATEEVERQLIELAMTKFKTLKQIAEALGVSESTICRKLKKMNMNLQ
jgi:DNA-directed RNA polymerase specialized sigma subunit